MRFMTIDDNLAPIRLLRQVEPVTDEELAEFLATERELKTRYAVAGEQWVDVIDCRRFGGLSTAQRGVCGAWLEANRPTLAQVSLGVALAVPAALREPAQRLAEQLERMAIPCRLSDDLETALHWALECTYDADGWVAPGLVLSGVEAFRLRA